MDADADVCCECSDCTGGEGEDWSRDSYWVKYLDDLWWMMRCLLNDGQDMISAGYDAFDMTADGMPFVVEATGDDEDEEAL